MTTTALFSIRRLLAMVTVIAGMFASLCYANRTTLLIVQTCVLGTLVVLVVLAMAGAARTRRFCIAAIAAALIHLMLSNADMTAIYGINPEGSPTVYCCSVLWNWIKVATPISIPISNYMPSVPLGAALPGSSTFQPSPSPPPSSTPPALATASDASVNSDVAAMPPAGDLTPQPASVVVTMTPQIAAPSTFSPPPNFAPPPYGASIEYKPDWQTFAQIGVLDATLLIGMVAGCAAVMLDQSRRHA